MLLLVAEIALELLLALEIPLDLVTFTEEIPNGKLHFLSSVLVSLSLLVYSLSSMVLYIENRVIIKLFNCILIAVILIFIVIIIVTLINIMKFRVICSGITTFTFGEQILFSCFLVLGKLFYLSVTQFVLLNLLCIPSHSYFQWFLNFPWMKDVVFFNNKLFFEIIQNNLFIVFASRILNSKHFSHCLLINTRGNYVAIEIGSVFLLPYTDLYFFSTDFPALWVILRQC